LIPLTLLSFGIAGLWAGTILAVRGALALSDRYGLSHGFVGLVVLAIGTDLPELVVAIDGGLKQLGGVETSGMVVGAAVGSAIVQGSLVVGAAGLFGYLPSGPKMVRRYGSMLLFTIGLGAVLTIDGTADRVDGAILLGVYAIYFAALFRFERRSGEEAAQLPVPGRLSPTQATVAGLGIVVASAHMVVEGGVALAEALGMSQTLLAVIFVGAGTSLPELALSIRAAAERHGSLSLANVIGSNIFDLLVPVGAGAVIHPLTVSRGTLLFDLPAAAVVTVALSIFLVRRRGLQKPEAAVMIALYVAYVAVRVGAS
jgi:cation:H+ antiporter